MKTVICTGTTGSERIAALKDLEKNARDNRRKLLILDVWEEIKQTGGQAIDEATILNWPAAERGALLDRAYKEVAGKLTALRKEGKANVVVVATHAVFFWRSTFMEAFPVQWLQELRADLFVTIIHNMRAVKENLEKDPHGRFSEITLSDIVHWRDQEISRTRAWAEELRRDHYVVARVSPPQTLYGLIFGSQKRVYISYPMSHVSTAEVRAARQLASTLRKRGYLVFDPAEIDDASYVGALFKEQSSRRGNGARLTPADLDSLATDVGDHTVRLDYVLIDQSNLVVVRYPSVQYQKYVAEKDKTLSAIYVPLSAGVICEMVHGFRGGKTVYAAWLAKNVEPSPFFRFHSQFVARTESELLDRMATIDPP